MAKVRDFIGLTNGICFAVAPSFKRDNRLCHQETRFDKGLELQKSIFSERIEQMHKSAPENQKHIQRYLSANCLETIRHVAD